MKRSRPMRLMAEPEKKLRKDASSSASKKCERRRLQIIPRLKLRLARSLRKLVPWAHGEAVVAAIDAVAHGRAEFMRDRALMLDGEVGDAAARVELVGRGEGVGRADVEAGAAGAAIVGLGLAWLEFRRR